MESLFCPKNPCLKKLIKELREIMDFVDNSILILNLNVEDADELVLWYQIHSDGGVELFIS